LPGSLILFISFTFVFQCQIKLVKFIRTMAKIFKCAGNDDKVTIKAEGENPDTVTFIFESSNQDKISDFDLKLMNIESDMLGIPDQDYQAVVNMSASEFQKICRDMTVVGDTVLISTNKEGIKFSVSGEVGNANILCRQGASPDSKSDESLTITLEEPVSLTFALKYLNYFTKATSLSNKVTISMAKEVPLVTEYQIEDLGYLKFYLAPKIDEETG